MDGKGRCIHETGSEDYKCCSEVLSDVNANRFRQTRGVKDDQIECEWTVRVLSKLEPEQRKKGLTTVHAKRRMGWIYPAKTWIDSTASLT